MDLLILIFGFFILVYGITLFATYLKFVILSYRHLRRNIFLNKLRRKEEMVNMPNIEGISILTSAYNESKSIIQHVQSSLNVQYSRYEIIIVNDGSTDDTLEKLINYFNLQKVDFNYITTLQSKPVKAFYRSKSKAFKEVLVIDKENGGCKADGINAAINASKYPYFLNIDADSIIHRDTLLYFGIEMFSRRTRVIAVGATLRMSNSCTIYKGSITEFQLPKNLLVRFQELEYLRSYIIGKLGWSRINALINISGALGLFDKEIVKKVGGYNQNSLAEDMDLIVRMSKYMLENKLDYRISYIPQTLCWTEAPESVKVLSLQRVRWARGLVQVFRENWYILFNPKYKIFGLYTFPYNFIFELCAPIVEFIGFILTIYLIVTNKINPKTTLILFTTVVLLAVLINSFAVLFDHKLFKYYKTKREVLSLALISFLEPVFYHPIIVFSYLKGYLYELFRKKHKWGEMERKGFKQNEKYESPAKT